MSTDVRAVWRRAAIAVLPSTYGEGMPKALLEAAACARPIVASDVPGCREAVLTGTSESGILVPPRDVAALADAIAALAADPARRAAMGRSRPGIGRSSALARRSSRARPWRLYRAALAEAGSAAMIARLDCAAAAAWAAFCR